MRMTELTISNALTKEKIGHKISQYCGEDYDGTIDILGTHYHIQIGCCESSVSFYNGSYFILGTSRENQSDIIKDVRNVISGKLNLDIDN